MKHSMVIIAYDDEKFGGSFLVMNSYGVDFGINGKIWLKYKDVKKLQGHKIVSIISKKQNFKKNNLNKNYLIDLKSKEFRDNYFVKKRAPKFIYMNDSSEKRCTF